MPSRLWRCSDNQAKACKKTNHGQVTRSSRPKQPAESGLPPQILFISCCLLSGKPKGHDGYSEIATIRLPVNLNDDEIRIHRSHRNRLRQLDAIPSFVGCASAERCMWPLLVVPSHVIVNLLLELTDTDWQDCNPEPNSQRPRTAAQPCR